MKRELPTTIAPNSFFIILYLLKPVYLATFISGPHVLRIGVPRTYK